MNPRLTTFGTTALVQSGDPGKPLRGKPLAVLCRLTFASSRQLSRDTLAEEIWGDLPPARARAQLRTALWQIRSRLGDGAVREEDDPVTLDAPIESDRSDFEEALQRRDRTAAIRLYAGDFLAGLSVPSAPGFDEWVDIERRMLRQLFAATVEGEVAGLLASGHFREAVTLAQRLRELEPFSQASWRLLIRSHVVAGHRDSARAVARACEEFLQQERLEVEAETALAIRGAIRVIRDDPVEPSPGLALDLVAREREFAALLRHLEATRRSGVRVVRILGSPGIGKTRLISDFARTSSARGHLTAFVAGARTTSRVPYGGLARAVERLAQLPGAAGVADAVASALLDLNPSLSSVYRASPVVARSPEVARVRLTALNDLLRAVCSERPLVVIIDDAQWLDDQSRAALESAAETCMGCSILFVIAERELSTSVLLARSDETITLAPFSPDECESLVTNACAAPDEGWLRPWVQSLHRASNGVPLRILDLLFLALETQRVRIENSTWHCQDPAGLLELTERSAPRAARFARLHVDARRIATLCGCAKEPLERDVVSDVLGLQASAVDAACEELSRHGMGRLVNGRVSLDHEEYVETARDLESADVRAELLRRLAEVVLQRSDRDAARRAFVFAEAAGDERLAATAARRFLKQARRQQPRRSTTELLAELTGVGDRGERFDRFASMFDIRRRWGRAGWGMAGVGLAAAVIVGFAARPDFEPDVVVSVTLIDNDGRYEARAKVETDRWRAGDPLVIDAGEARFLARRAVHGLARTAEVRPRWVAQAPNEAPRLDDIVLLDESGKERVIVADSGDDTGPSWSPDGRFIVYVTSRWAHRESADLALLDLETNKSIRLGGGPGELSMLQVTSDASGVTYARAFDGRSRHEVCLMDLVDRRQTCRPVPAGMQVSGSPAFIPSLGLVAAFRDTLRHASHVIAYNLDGNAEREIAFCPGSLIATGIGTLIVCRYESSGQLYAAPLSAPNAWRPLLIRNLRGRAVGTISAVDLRPRGLLREVVIASSTSPIVGIPHQLRVVAISKEGESLSVRRPRWSVVRGDGAIDSAGNLVVRSPGILAVRVAASLEISDTVILSAIRGTRELVLDEQWDSTWTKRWKSFGLPSPSAVSTPSGNAFWNAGDGRYQSGAYTLRSFDPSAGLVLDADVEVPTTMSGEQFLRISLLAGNDSTTTAWDHRTGYYPRTGNEAECAFEYPTGLAGPEFGTYYASNASRGLATPTMRNGRRFHVRLQLLPDGRCGAFLDGKSTGPMTPPRQWPSTRILIYGSSVGRQVLVHRLTLRRGS